jgi:predicted nucleic acid-binding protein
VIVVSNQNITLSLPEEDLRAARILAARRGTSVSQLLARMLRELVRMFVDTNILLYAYDDSAGTKRDQARALLEELWESREGCLSVQVLQEFFVNATRKIAKPLSAETAKEIVADMAHWHVHVPAADDVLGAIGIHQRAGISFWDSMIVRSAAEMGCNVLYSEDLNTGQDYSGVRVENPFQPPKAGPE